MEVSWAPEFIHLLGIALPKLVDNNVMHAKPDLRVFLKWLITRSGSVITDVIHLGAI